MGNSLEPLLHCLTMSDPFNSNILVLHSLPNTSLCLSPTYPKGLSQLSQEKGAQVSERKGIIQQAPNLLVLETPEPLGESP